MEIPTDWTFKDSEVARSFDRHVREQLPWYELATGAVAHIGRHYIPQNGIIYDIGASTGNIGRAISETIRTRNARLVGIESSSDMAELYDAPGTLVIANAADYDFEPFDLAVCFLTVMFMPIERRRDFLRRMESLIKPGGAMIIFDKEEPPHGYVGTVLHRLTLAGKVATGVPSDEIVRKELSLSGVQRPISPRLITTTCPQAQEVFRFGEFAGYLIERPE